MLVALFLFGLCPLVGSGAWAQEDPEDRPPTALEAGAWALEFGVGKSAALRPFLGSTISFKRHLSAARAWQVGVTLEASVRSKRTETEDTDFTDPSSSEINENDERIVLRGRYLAYPLLGDQSTETIQLYTGVGPQLTFDRADRESFTDVKWGIGVTGVVGAEWFVHRRISVRGQYSASLLYQRDDVDNESNEATQTINTVVLSADGVRLGVSVYF